MSWNTFLEALASRKGEKMNALHRRCFIVAPNGEKEERYQLETVIQHIVHCPPRD